MGLEFTIGFLKVSLWDILDVGIVAYLLFQLYKLLRGSIAFNIFIGLLLIYMSWFVVKQLGMDLLSSVLDQFVQVGIIILIVIFQPEVRRFLLLLGDTTLRQRSNFLGRIMERGTSLVSSSEELRQEIVDALLRMGRQRIGALLVLAGELNLDGVATGGVLLDAQISRALIESIFNKESPLHDGAVLIQNGKLTKAGCILPVSESTDLPAEVGLRHRAGVGVTEKANVVALIVSEEKGTISFARAGRLERKIKAERIAEILKEYL
ncbi:MAG: TIGR00159 family protein [Bacteroidetes bacterium]|nr:MAG: TIGR00159 family protein [Bacteroidota bacterium]